MRAEHRREQLLDVTKQIVGEQGFHAVSIEAVARRAGVSRPIVYAHFGDLAGLLEAMVAREAARAIGQLTEVLPRELERDDPLEALLAALRAYLETVRADPVTWRLALMPPEGAPVVLREDIERGRAAIVGLLAEFVGPGLVAGAGSPDPELTARTLSALSDESARLLLTDPERYPIERLMAHAQWLLKLARPVGAPESSG